MSRGRGFLVAIIAIVLGSGGTRLLGAEVRYPITSIGSFTPSGMNDHGQVVGFTGAGGQPQDRRAALWLPAPAYGLPAGLNDLGTLSTPSPGGGESRGAVANGINNLGQVTGSAGAGGYGQRAMLWLPAPAYGRPAGWGPMDATPWDGGGGAINDAGQVAGHYHEAERAYLWLPAAANGLPAGTNLLEMPTGGWAFGTGINSAGTVVGYNSQTRGGSAAFVYRPTASNGQPAGTFDLPNLPGSGGSTPTAINDRGQVVGYARFPGTGGIPYDRGFLWLPEADAATGRAAGLYELFTSEPGYVSVTPTDINDAGFVVGNRNHDGTVSPFLWDPATGQFADLNALIDPAAGWRLIRAVAINDAGQVVGEGELNGVRQAFLITVPEPACGVLLLAAPALGLRRRRRS